MRIDYIELKNSIHRDGYAKVNSNSLEEDMHTIHEISDSKLNLVEFTKTYISKILNSKIDLINENNYTIIKLK